MHMPGEIYRTRVVLADRQADVRSALRLLITDSVGLQVVGEATDATELWTQIQTVQPELLVLDWGMISAQAATLLSALRTICPRLQIIALSWRPEVRPEVLAARVDAFVSKVDPPERLLKALRAVRASAYVEHPAAPGNDSPRAEGQHD